MHEQGVLDGQLKVDFETIKKKALPKEFKFDDRQEVRRILEDFAKNSKSYFGAIFDRMDEVYEVAKDVNKKKETDIKEYEKAGKYIKILRNKLDKIKETKTNLEELINDPALSGKRIGWFTTIGSKAKKLLKNMNKYEKEFSKKAEKAAKVHGEIRYKYIKTSEDLLENVISKNLSLLVNEKSKSAGIVDSQQKSEKDFSKIRINYLKKAIDDYAEKIKASLSQTMQEIEVIESQISENVVNSLNYLGRIENENMSQNPPRDDKLGKDLDKEKDDLNKKILEKKEKLSDFKKFISYNGIENLGGGIFSKSIGEKLQSLEKHIDKYEKKHQDILKKGIKKEFIKDDINKNNSEVQKNIEKTDNQQNSKKNEDIPQNNKGEAKVDFFQGDGPIKKELEELSPLNINPHLKKSFTKDLEEKREKELQNSQGSLFRL